MYYKYNYYYINKYKNQLNDWAKSLSDLSKCFMCFIPTETLIKKLLSSGAIIRLKQIDIELVEISILKPPTKL